MFDRFFPDHKTVLQVCEELVQRLTEMDGE